MYTYKKRNVLEHQRLNDLLLNKRYKDLSFCKLVASWLLFESFLAC